MLLYVGDGVYSTAPSSPDSKKETVLPVPQNVTELRRDSYDMALKDSDLLWEWHSGPNNHPPGDEQRAKMNDVIKEQSSPPVPKHIGSAGRHTSLGDSIPAVIQPRPGAPAIVNANTGRVQVGFDPPISATSLSSLPGTSCEVITSPPHPSNKPSTTRPSGGSPAKPISIEELDEKRLNYVPPIIRTTKNMEGSPDYDANAFCLDLSSLTGHYPNLAVKDERGLKRERGGEGYEGEENQEDEEKVIDGEPRSSHSSQETKQRSSSFDMRDVVSA